MDIVVANGFAMESCTFFSREYHCCVLHSTRCKCEDYNPNCRADMRRPTMEFEQSEIKSVKPGEPILVLNKNAYSFEVGSAITFKKDGVYLVTVSGNKITVEKWNG